MVEIRETAIPEVKLVIPKRFGDHRGFFSESFRADWGLLPEGLSFQQDNHAFSAAPNTLRGLHFQHGTSTQAKLLRVAKGAVLDVAVDIRRGSPTYGQHVAAELSAENGEQLLIPHGFAHGYQTLTPDAHVLYKCDRYYDPSREGAVRWDDPALAVAWRALAADPQLSDKDRIAPLFADLNAPFVYDPASPFACRCEDV